MRRGNSVLAATLATFAAGAASAGGELRVDWSSIDAGGGSASASAGSFQLSGMIAQIDAEPLQPASGGNFQRIGSFWVIGS